ncbi:PREDICTED: non-specific lipid-transfer protein-like protein At2g13820 [Tarenaya hassleriana]|uniref:non-specific lipid-transfer protein-like protein At2g13820 n=1 Tax=Tarenaya hassleriana TaxID=28532 RepID=UPI00053C6282|nr:PREDICTED: non-specific lipid-transfer protein-like protein At2g13820 [Tarenaya hassleriana]
MKQSLVLAISLLVALVSSSSIAPIHGRQNSQAKPPAMPPAVSPAPGPSNSDCSTIIFNMADCLSFISEGSTDPKPTKSCCDGMNSVLEYNPKCICAGLDSGRQMGIQLNNTRAVSMPSLCKATITPPDCGIASAGPSPSSPNASPSAPTPSTPPSAEAPGGSEAVPEAPTPAPVTEETTTPPSSAARTMSVSVLFLVAMTLFSFS